MRCPMCGTPSEADAFFCGNCGTSLRAAPTPSDAASWNNANPYVAPTPSDAASWNNANSYAASGALNVGPSFAGAFGYCFAKFCSFKGRATRMEFWGWTVFATLILVVLSFIYKFAIRYAFETTDYNYEAAELIIGIIGVAMFVLHTILRLPTLSVGVRRAHDFGMPMAPVLLYHAISFGCGLTTLLHFAVIPQTYWVVDQDSPLCWLGFALYWLGIVLTLLLGTISGSRGANRYGEKRYNPGSAPSPWENGVAAPNWNAPNAAAPNWNAPNAAAPGWNAPNAASNWNAPNAASNWASSGDEAAEATSLEELLAKLNSLESDEPNVGPSFFGSFAYCWKNCFNFNGRANRTEWWGFHFAVAAPIAAFCYLAISILGIRLDLDEMKLWGLGVFAAALSLPSLALTVRRLHDLGMAGSVLTSKLVEMGIAIVIGVVLAGLARIPVGAIIVTIIVAIQILALWGKIAFAPGTFGFNLYGSRRLNPSDVKRS